MKKTSNPSSLWSFISLMPQKEMPFSSTALFPLVCLLSSLAPQLPRGQAWGAAGKAQSWPHPIPAYDNQPVVMYGCESWTIKKAECQRIDAFELWCWRRLLNCKEIQPFNLKGNKS